MNGFHAHPYAYYEPPLILVDHPRERLHQHTTFIDVVARKNPDQKAYPNHPDVDISDTISCYLIELEVPGIKKADTINLNWTSGRSLVVAGSTFRSWDSETWEDIQVEASNVDNQLPPFLVSGERRIGSF
jgi:HSP20 family molecular chaperone IbpA